MVIEGERVAAGRLGSVPLPAESRSGRVAILAGGCRTPFCRAKGGGLVDLRVDQLLAHVLDSCLRRSGLDPAEVDEVVCGSVLQPGGGAAMARMAAFEAGLSTHCSVMSVNRQCASGLEAIAVVAGKLRDGSIRVGLGCGAESMSSTSMASAAPVVSWEAVRSCKLAAACTLPMGVTSDNVARLFGISRAAQDAFAAESHRRAARARRLGIPQREIVPLAGVSADDGVREDCSLESLRGLRPAFSEEGSTTAGNSSQVSDGAAAVALMLEATALARGLEILGFWRSYAVVGVEPAVMGVGPLAAIPRALRLAGLTVADVDVFEINEVASASNGRCPHIPSGLRLAVPVLYTEAR